MKIKLKKGAMVYVSNEKSRKVITTDKEVEFDSMNVMTVCSDIPFRYYTYKKPYPLYNNEPIHSIDWYIDDKNEIVEGI